MNTPKTEFKYLLIFGAFWVVLILVSSHFLGIWDEQQRNPNQQLVSQTDNGVTEVELQASRQGHYLANGTINSREVTFILDTGATLVAVSEEVAQQAGLPRGQRGRAQTAAGTVDVWSTTIDELRVGGIRFRNVSATINPGMDPNMVLLGMSVLSQVDFSQRDGVLTLRQSPQ
ncbi:MAG: TIGR02281 family clan AA aspartic protease [Oleiphilaceae bacterium]|nr:TIGR02281 family clan AA aspartic protease [Oleiphilaceae bacterium]